MVMRPKGKAILVLSAVFLLGAVAGAGTVFALHMKEQSTDEARDWSRHAEMRLDALSRALDLSDAQRAQVGALLDEQAPERRAELERIMADCGEPLREHKARLDAAIRKLLTPAQQEKFDQLAKRQEERIFRFGGRGFGGRGRHGWNRHP